MKILYHKTSLRTLRKIRGEASKPKTNDNQEGQETEKPRSNSQQSYDKRIDHFTGLISLVNQVPSYIPNEAELNLTGLDAYLTKLVSRNTNVINAHTEHSKAMHERNEILYNKFTGLLNRAKLVKLYFKGIFGTTSDQYKQVAAIEFRNIKP